MDIASSLSPEFIVAFNDTKVPLNMSGDYSQFFIFFTPVKCALSQILEHVQVIFTNKFLFKGQIALQYQLFITFLSTHSNII